MTNTTGSRRIGVSCTLVAIALALGNACGSSNDPATRATEGGADDSASPAPNDDGGSPVEGGSPTPVEAGPVTYYVGSCEFGSGSGAISADAGPAKHGLTVLATGVQASAGLEVDAASAYFATGTDIERIALSGGAPVVMVSNATPGSMVLSGSTLLWTDSSQPGTTLILSAPLTALGWLAVAPSADGGAGGVTADGGGSLATVLAAVPGSPGPLTLSGNYVYFAADAVTYRVLLGGGSVETVFSGMGPSGIAVLSTGTVLLGDGNNETVDQVPPGMPDGGLGLFAESDGSPTALALSSDGATLYWGDEFGAIDFVPVAMPMHNGLFGTPCGGGACFPRHVRAGGPGVLWESGDNICGNVGTVGPQGGTLFAEGIAAVQSLASDAQHLYVSTVVGELLRFDL